MKTQATYGIYLGVYLITLFLFERIWPVLSNYTVGSYIITFIIISLLIVFLFRHKQSISNNVKYLSLIRTGLAMGAIGGVFAAVFYFIYTSAIDKSYINALAMKQVALMKQQRYQDFEINQSLRIMGVLNKLHFEEVSIIMATTLKALACSLIIAGFFSQPPKGNGATAQGSNE